jgi:YD repeat-containing protein
LFTVGYSHANAHQTGITYPSGRAITYGFDAQGQINTITMDGTTSSFGAGLPLRSKSRQINS